jgi:Protein of unknown function (DUF2934)
MSKAQRKAKMIKLVVAEDHLVITRDDVARRAYELFLARGQGEGHEVEDWLEAERQLEAESMAPSIENRTANRR